MGVLRRHQRKQEGFLLSDEGRSRGALPAISQNSRLLFFTPSREEEARAKWDVEWVAKIYTKSYCMKRIPQGLTALKPPSIKIEAPLAYAPPSEAR